MRRRSAAAPPAAVLLAAMLLVLWAAPAEAAPQGQAAVTGSGAASTDPACDPAVERALADSARAGVEADLAIIRHPDQGIRNPDSILDFSCIGDLFDYSGFDILFDPRGALDEILDLARRRICQAAREAYRGYLGRALDPSIYTVPARRLPGLDLDPRRRSVLDDAGARSGDGALFRDAIGGGQ